jgi:hypothetical protein
MKTKHCSACKQDLPDTEFYFHIRYKDRKQPNCKDCDKRVARERLQIIKRTVMDWYGGKCRCCGECSNLMFLTIDHVNDDGKREYNGIPCAKRIGNTKGGGAGAALYSRIHAKGFDARPKDLQVLCWNCQWGKQLGKGFCPHHPDIDLRIVSK